MTLTVALNSARSSLMATGTQASMLSRNIAGVAQDGYSRKNALVSTMPGNGVYVAGIQRAGSAGLFYNVLKAASTTAKQDVLYNGLQKIAASHDRRSAARPIARRAARQAEKRAAAVRDSAGQYHVRASRGERGEGCRSVAQRRHQDGSGGACPMPTPKWPPRSRRSISSWRSSRRSIRRSSRGRSPARCHRLSRSARQHPVEALAGGRA